MKKKAAGLTGNVPGTGTGMLLSDEHSRGNDGESIIPSNQRLGISDKVRGRSPGLSEDEEEDQEVCNKLVTTSLIGGRFWKLCYRVIVLALCIDPNNEYSYQCIESGCIFIRAFNVQQLILSLTL